MYHDVVTIYFNGPLINKYKFLPIQKNVPVLRIISLIIVRTDVDFK